MFALYNEDSICDLNCLHGDPVAIWNAGFVYISCHTQVPFSFWNLNPLRQRMLTPYLSTSWSSPPLHRRDHQHPLPRPWPASSNGLHTRDRESCLPQWRFRKGVRVNLMMKKPPQVRRLPLSFGVLVIEKNVKKVIHKSIPILSNIYI